MNAIRRRLRILLVLFAAVALLGTVGFMVLEDLTFVDALYFNIATMSTVGYGDIHPTREVSRLFAILLIVMGGATFLGVVANASELMLLKRDSRERARKVNMVMGVFFSEIGNRLLGLFAGYDPGIAALQNRLASGGAWGEADFRAAHAELAAHDYAVEFARVDPEGLRELLSGKRDFLVRLLENPVLIEHEAFSETLLAIFHLAEELSYRSDFSQIPESDAKHLAGDLRRAYQYLAGSWLDYLGNLKEHYPYLFSLALRVNPFDRTASPVVRG